MSENRDIHIVGNKNSNIAVGTNIMIQASTKIEQAPKETISDNSENWKQVFLQLQEIQKALQQVPEQHEELRDEELNPAISETKREVKKLIENPASDKSSFLDKLKKISDVSATVVDIGTKISPFFKIIGGLIGIPF